MTPTQQFWTGIVRANPGFGQADDTKVTLTIAAVRKLVNKAHKHGFNSGMQTSKILEGIGQTSNPDDDFLAELLRKNNE